MNKILLLTLMLFLSGCMTLTPTYKQEFSAITPLSEMAVDITPARKLYPWDLRFWNIEIRNNSNRNIIFLIDESSYVSTSGNAERLIRGQARRIHSDISQPIISIPPQSKLTETFFLEKDASLDDNILSYAPIAPLDPSKPAKFYLVFEIDKEKKTWVTNVKFIKEKDQYIMP